MMQYAEGLPDRPAADTVRGRIDWKYALSLTLDDPGVDAFVLCAFRTRLVGGGLEQQRPFPYPRSIPVLKGGMLAPHVLMTKS